jgi:hypothetical protein
MLARISTESNPSATMSPMPPQAGPAGARSSWAVQLREMLRKNLLLKRRNRKATAARRAWTISAEPYARAV